MGWGLYHPPLTQSEEDDVIDDVIMVMTSQGLLRNDDVTRSDVTIGYDIIVG